MLNWIRCDNFSRYGYLNQFLKSGRMSAVLIDLGIRESRNDMLTMSVIVGTNSAMHSFRSHVTDPARMTLQVTIN